MPKSIRVVEQAISPDKKTGTLKLVGIGGIHSNDEVSGSVSLVKEESVCKISREEWSNKEH
jgi:hypothetical protein